MKAFYTVSILILAFLSASVQGQAPRENARGPLRGPQRRALDAIQPGSPAEVARARETCDSVFRTINGLCTNPFFRLFGSTNRAQSSLFFSHSSEFPTGEDLPSARFVSNVLLQQSTDRFNDRDLNELLVFFGQFIDHTFAATPLSGESFPIEIPEDDPIFANFTNGELEFRRSSRARVDLLGIFGSAARSLARRIPRVLRDNPNLSRGPGVSTAMPSSLNPTVATPPPTVRQGRGRGPSRPNPRATPGGEGPNSQPTRSELRFFANFERPINSLTSALDLSSVYGVDDERAQELRAPGGKLLVDDDNLLPLNERGLNNAPTSEDVYFLAGDQRSNEHPVLTSFHTLFVREHNLICEELKTAFPTMSDDDIYENARKINGAQFQKIVFEEFYPAITGRDLPTYRGFRFYRNPAIIDVFSTAAFRVGHTMVGNQLSRAGPGNAPLSAIPFTQMFFRTAAQFKAFGDFENFLRGAMQTNAQEIDLQVHDALRNFLFTGIPEEGGGFDLPSLNIQRGRDHALPTFNAIRERLGIPRATSFADITSSGGIQSNLATVYGNVDRVEAWVGLIGEDHQPGSSFGRTMLALWERQFTNLRDGDRFFFRNNIFSDELVENIPKINAIFSTPELLKEIIVRNTKITSGEVPPQVFFKR